MSNFSSNITMLRKAKRLTQRECAEAIGVKEKRYAAWEQGEGIPNLYFMVKLCELFGTYDIYKMVTASINAN